MTKTHDCPNCAARLPVYEGYTTWCDQCNWNVVTEERVRVANTFYGRLLRDMRERYTDSVFGQLMAGSPPYDKFSLQLSFVYLICSVVLLGWLSIGFLAVYLFSLWPNIVASSGAMLCSLLFVFLRPKISKDTSARESDSSLPELRNLVKEVARALGSDRNYSIVIDADFNASMGYSGIRRERVLHLGYPLLKMLSHQELVALLGHEIGHDVNRDPHRSTLFAISMDTLESLVSVTMPSSLFGSPARFPGTRTHSIIGAGKIFSLPFNLLLWLFAQSLLLIMRLLTLLTYRISQRQEYFADFLSAKVAGQNAASGLLQRITFDETLQLSVQRAVLQKSKVSVLDSFLANANNVPEREHARLLRKEDITRNSVDSSHPPTSLRRKYIGSLQHVQPLVVVNKMRGERLYAELQEYDSRIDARLRNDYISSLLR